VLQPFCFLFSLLINSSHLLSEEDKVPQHLLVCVFVGHVNRCVKKIQGKPSPLTGSIVLFLEVSPCLSRLLMYTSSLIESLTTKHTHTDMAKRTLTLRRRGRHPGVHFFRGIFCLLVLCVFSLYLDNKQQHGKWTIAGC
jgi:hypothetical protein